MKFILDNPKCSNFNNLSIFVRSVGSVPKSGPVRSGLRSRIGLALISVRIGSTKFFPTAWNFQKKSLERRDRFRQKIVEIGAILAIFEPFEVWKIRVPFFGEFGQSSQDLGDSDYNSIKSRDDRLNSPKSGIWIFRLVMWWYDDTMRWWYDGMMIWWYDDMMTWWYGDMKIWRYDDMMT